jgi:antitoxin component YwqK of YwqJK toxin-antitoxin module
MKRVRFFCMLLWASACSPTERQEVGHYPNGEIEYRVSLNEKEVYTGIFTRFYPSGVKQAELPYARGHINGVVKRYFPTGQLMSTAYYTNGARAGEVKGFYPTGELRSQGTIYRDVPSGPMRYYYRNGKLQHFRLYDTRGKVVDVAEFTTAGTIDERYTRVMVYAPRDTIQIGETLAFEVILAGQTAQTVAVRFRGQRPQLDSVKGEFSAYRYLEKGLRPGRLCLSGGILQSRTQTTATWFPWKHCFMVAAPPHSAETK